MNETTREQTDPHAGACAQALQAALHRAHRRARDLDDETISARRRRAGTRGKHRRPRIDLRVALNDLLGEGDS